MQFFVILPILNKSTPSLISVLFNTEEFLSIFFTFLLNLQILFTKAKKEAIVINGFLNFLFSVSGYLLNQYESGSMKRYYEYFN